MSGPGRSSPPVRPGDVVSVAIVDLAFGGAGVARVDGYTVFVNGAIPGQRVKVRIMKRKPAFAEASLLAVEERSPDEVAARCLHFGVCGGCAWQNLPYERQLEAKASQVRDCLTRIGGLPDPPVADPVPAASPFEYRNKMEFSFTDQVWRTGPPNAGSTADFGCGLKARGRWDKVVNLTECHLMPPWVARTLTAAREAALSTGFPPYATRSHGGFFRFLVLREGVHTGEKMVNLITYPVRPETPEERAVGAVLEAARAAAPDVTSLIHGVTSSRASVAFCESFRAVHGLPFIRERLLEDTFEIGPNTFFQTNTLQAERLFQLALDTAGGPVGLAYDLYCGVGALTLPLSHWASHVVGVELMEASVMAARRNAELSRRDNVTFIAADMKRALSAEGIVDAGGRRVAGKPDLVVVDPPRDGLHPDVVKALLALSPPRLVYVSCNPATLARDAALLVAGGWRLEKAVPVDMFPQTAHVEVVAAFGSNSAARPPIPRTAPAPPPPESGSATPE